MDLQDKLYDIVNFDKMKLLTNRPWERYEYCLEKICEHYKGHEAHTDSVPSGPDTSKFRATRSGFIEVREEYISYGGYYGFTRYLPYALLVGRNVKSNINKEIEELVQLLTEKAIRKCLLNGKTGHFHNGHGSNFSVFGLAF